MKRLCFTLLVFNCRYRQPHFVESAKLGIAHDRNMLYARPHLFI